MKRLSRQQWLLLLVLILLLANVATLSLFWSSKGGPDREDHRGGPDRGKRMSLFLVNELKFTPQQEKTYWQLRDEHLKRIKPLADSIRTARKQMLELLNDSTTNDSLLNNRAELIGSLQKQMDLLTFRHFMRVKNLCTSDQQQKFDTVISELFRRMNSFRHASSKQPGTSKDSANKQ